MTRKGGKCDHIKMSAQKHKRILHVGDGLHDYAAHDLVTRSYVGFGGAIHRYTPGSGGILLYRVPLRFTASILLGHDQKRARKAQRGPIVRI